MSARRFITSIGLIAVAATIALVAPPGSRLVAPAAAADVLPAPTGLSVTSDSQGLAVSVDWNSVAGATKYRVYRSTSSTMLADDATFLSSAPGSSFRDDWATAGRTLYYRIRAVDAAGVAGTASTTATITTSDGMADSRDSAITWLSRQQEQAEGFRTTFDHPYGPAYSGRVEGHVEDVDQLPAVVDAPAVAFSEAYSDSYVGPVTGTWENVAPRTDYRVDVYSRADIDYLQGSFPLQANGTWTSGETTIHAGAKIAYLVRVADDAQVARSGGPDEVVSGVSVEVYTRTDIDYLLATVPLGSDGKFVADDIRAGGGLLIARLVNTSTDRALNSTEWAGVDSYLGLVRSFKIPFDDPAYGYEGDAERRTGYRLEPEPKQS